MLGKAFCGNGFIHLNIAEIHEEDIGGQKKCARIGDQGVKWAISTIVPDHRVIFLKRSESKLAAFVLLVRWGRLGFCRVYVAVIDSSGKGPVGIAFLALQFEPCPPSIRSAHIADDDEFSTTRTPRSLAGQYPWFPFADSAFSAFLAEQQHSQF